MTRVGGTGKIATLRARERDRLLLDACKILARVLERVGPAHNYDLIRDSRDLIRRVAEATTPARSVNALDQTRVPYSPDPVVYETLAIIATITDNLRAEDRTGVSVQSGCAQRDASAAYDGWLREQRGEDPPPVVETKPPCRHSELLRDIAINGLSRCSRHEIGEVEPAQCRHTDGLCDAHRIEDALTGNCGEWSLVAAEYAAATGYQIEWCPLDGAPIDREASKDQFIRPGDRRYWYRKAGKGGA